MPGKIGPPAARRASRLARSSSLTVRLRQPAARSSPSVVGRACEPPRSRRSRRVPCGVASVSRRRWRSPASRSPAFQRMRAASSGRTPQAKCSSWPVVASRAARTAGPSRWTWPWPSRAIGRTWCAAATRPSGVEDHDDAEVGQLVVGEFGGGAEPGEDLLQGRGLDRRGEAGTERRRAQQRPGPVAERSRSTASGSCRGRRSAGPPRRRGHRRTRRRRARRRAPRAARPARPAPHRATADKAARRGAVYPDGRRRPRRPCVGRGKRTGSAAYGRRPGASNAAAKS